MSHAIFPFILNSYVTFIRLLIKFDLMGLKSGTSPFFHHFFLRKYINRFILADMFYKNKFNLFLRKKKCFFLRDSVLVMVSRTFIKSVII